MPTPEINESCYYVQHDPHKGGFPVMAETTRNHIFSKEISQVILNRSHRFGAKFLLKKLSASDFSYERKSAFSVKFPFDILCRFGVIKESFLGGAESAPPPPDEIGLKGKLQSKEKLSSNGRA